MGARFMAAAALIAWAWPAAAQVPQGSVQAGVRGGVALVEVVTRVGFETTIVLPPGWRVVERRLGDPDRWIAAGGGHLTMVRPLARGVATNLSLVLSDGSVLSIGLRESDLSPVHTVVHLGELPPEDALSGEAGGAAAIEDGAGVVEDVVAGTGAEDPVFLSAADVEAIRREEERALEALRGAEAQVRDRVEDAVAAADEAVEAFAAGYPTRLHFVFEFEGMWHDTQSTFIRFRRVVDDEIVVAGLLPDGTARVLPHEVIGAGFVVRVDGVVEAGTVGVGDLGAGARWRMRREAEPWQIGN
ncbi:MAG: TrbG/VirB9 family P-type conjugative transfer protein [Acidobacteria bacterium]|nr:TrbG/VirB9 family P-type conjugative transfer protein [Acidobacteriota bacterium]